MSRIGLLQGTLAMLVLKSLDDAPQHGYGIARTIERATDDVLHVEEGSLYPALQRMLKRGWVKARWQLSENKRKARYYELTDEGRAQLRQETADWTRYTAAVARMLGGSEQQA